jgi:hypothetical protein
MAESKKKEKKRGKLRFVGFLNREISSSLAMFVVSRNCLVY